MTAIPLPTYFLAPSCDYVPDSLICLGSIITDPLKPEKILNKNARVPIPDREVEKPYKDNWQDTLEKLREHKVTLWASFLQMVLGIGGDVAATYKVVREDVYKFERLDTHFFVPDEEYVRRSLQSGGVRGYIDATKYRKPVFMVTGVKIARGATVTSKNVKECGGMLKIGVDGTMVGAPVSGGPKVESTMTRTEKVEFGGSSDYVFAYRVVRIKLKRSGDVSQDDYTKGAMFGLDCGLEETAKEGLNHGWIVEVTDAEAEGSQNLWPSTSIYEDGEDSLCIIVKPQ
jgi:hypothetical protein